MSPTLRVHAGAQDERICFPADREKLADPIASFDTYL